MNAKIVSPVLGLIVWLGLTAAGLKSITAFIIGVVAGLLLGPVVAKIFGGRKPEQVFSELSKAVLKADYQKVIQILRKHDDETLDEVSAITKSMLSSHRYSDDMQRRTLEHILEAIKRHKSTVYLG